jgi:HK97 family phage major capsid protein
MAVDNAAWDGSAAMSVCAASDDPAAAYAKVCAGRRDGDPAVQSTWALPHHREPGMGPNADGVRNSLSRLPQTEGLTNGDAAESHLQAHMDAIRAAAEASTADAVSALDAEGPIIHLNFPDERLTTLSVPQRRLGLRAVPYGVVAEHPVYGRLMFEQGAFGKVDPTTVRLRMDHEDPPTGVGKTFEDKADGAYMDFSVSKTSRGDDQLTLAVDGVSRGASIGITDIPGRSQTRTVGGRPTTVYGPNSAVLAEVSTTWMPTFAEAGVMYVLHTEGKGTAPMAETQTAPVDGANDLEALRRELTARDEQLGKTLTGSEERIDKVLSAFDALMEHQRAQFTVPAAAEPQKPKLHHWVEMALRHMRAQTVSPSVLKQLALDDVVTSDNPGLVPDVLTPDYDDIINEERPFLSSTRKIEAPPTGNSLILPILTTRAVAGTQTAEKADIADTVAPKVGTGTFAYQSIFGGADVSIQMLNRAERSFFDLLTSELGEAYALDAETKALAALLAGYTDSASVAHAPDAGGEITPADLEIGGAWSTAITVARRAPDTMWMNADAVAAFIDAKNPTTNGPLYSNLAAAFTTGGGPGGSISGLRPVYVPAMNGGAVDVIIGPSRGFVWAEDAARNLQVDVPSKAGRDVALVGGIFPAPRYADAFTTYTLPAT